MTNYEDGKNANQSLSSTTKVAVTNLSDVDKTLFLDNLKFRQQQNGPRRNSLTEKKCR